MDKQSLQKFLNFFLSDTKLIAYYQASRFGTQLLIAVLLTNLNFHPSKLTHYETILLTINSFVFFWNTGTTRLFQSTYSAHPLPSFPNQILCTSLIFSFFTSAVYLTLTGFYEPIHYLVALKIFLSILLNPLEYYWLAMKKRAWLFLEITLYFLLYGIWTVTAYLYLSLEILVLGWIALDLVKGLLWIREYSFSFSLLPSALQANWIYLSLSALISGGVEYLNSWLVKLYYADLDFLIYRYGAREIPISTLLAYSLSATLSAQVHTPEFSNLSARQKITRLMHLTFPFSIGFLLFSEPLFRLLYGNALSPSHKVFDIFLLLNISRVMVLDFYLLAYQKHSFFILTSLTELGIVCFMTYLIIYLGWAVEWCALSIGIAYLVEKFLILWRLWTLKIYFYKFFPYRWWLLYSALLLLIFYYKNG